MTTHRTTSTAAALVALLVAGLGVGPALAQDSRPLRDRIVANQLNPQMSQQLQNLFDTGEEPKTFEFKVPARFDAVPACVTTGGVLQCGLVPTNFRCPDQVELQDPATGQSVTVDVTCTGPDSEGQCDCDIRQ